VTTPRDAHAPTADDYGRPDISIALEAAVPLHILLMRDWPETRRINEAQWAAGVIAERGDVLQYGGKPGAAAAAFNALAKGLAVAAFAPGGVTFAGLHWCVDHSVCTGETPAPALPIPLPRRRPVVDVELPA
jgi:hypothetical protein